MEVLQIRNYDQMNSDHNYIKYEQNMISKK